MGTNCYRSAPILSRIHIICLHSFILFNVHSVHSFYLRFGQVFLHVYLSFHLPHHFRYYHEKKHFYRLLCMLSNEVVERAKSLVNHNVLDKLDEVSKCQLSFGEMAYCGKILQNMKKDQVLRNAYRVKFLIFCMKTDFSDGIPDAKFHHWSLDKILKYTNSYPGYFFGYEVRNICVFLSAIEFLGGVSNSDKHYTFLVSLR